VIEGQAARQAATLWRLGREIHLHVRWRGWQGTEISVEGPGFSFQGIPVPLVGEHQAANAALAVAAGHLLGAPPWGIAGTRWPGRLEVVRHSPTVVLDGAHNPAALAQLGAAIRRLEGARRAVVVFGMMADKDVAASLAELKKMRPAKVIFTAASGSRAARPHQLAEEWLLAVAADKTPAEIEGDPIVAGRRAVDLAGPEGLVLVCGSLYLVGELSRPLAGEPR
ncbi:MAG: bifunctional folylpolyglutamate synthase/dihydrofolate synthase, partial [Candidatus Dormibacteraeota bacterium]|nr:bifunctional folylpolyglutamate synthase/dihydrofolate synthase [Candidatus Dormibacteraeota bacterium]